MSPEQLRAMNRSIVVYLDVLNAKSDMYAFGMVCYQVLFRMEPFQEHHLTKSGKTFFRFEIFWLIFFTHFRSYS